MIPNAPPGDDWFEPEGATRFAKDDIVVVCPPMSANRRVAVVVGVWCKTNEPVFYNVVTIDAGPELVLRRLESYNLAHCDLTEMEILALQAPSNEGKEE